MFFLLIGATLISGCGKNPSTEIPNEVPPEVIKIQENEEALKRDQKRIENLHAVTYALAQYSQKYEKYPEADTSWCGDQLIETLKKEVEFYDVQDPQTQSVADLQCEKTGIYYFFRDNNPDYYTFGIKLENDHFGNSYLAPQEIAKLSLEQLKPIRLGEEGTRGNFYYIIGNYPTKLLPQVTQ